jgi:hypothetical protein
MYLLSQEHLNRLLAPKANDPQRLATILHQYMPECTLHSLEKLVVDLATRDGYQCLYQGPYDGEAG